MPIQELRRLDASLVIAWSGAAMFTGSLTWFLYSYVVRFGAPSPGAALIAPVTQNVLMFSVFALHHSLLARARAKRWVQRVVSPELERSVYTWAASLLFIAVCGWWRPVPGTLYRVHGSWALIGYAVQALGIIVTARGSAAIDVLDLAGVRPVLLARSGRGRDHVALETRGIYRIVRHPIYFGWALFVFGAPDMTATRFVFAVVSTTYLVVAIPWEERDLIESFGASYEDYRRYVRWRIFPGIY
jgi:protein-S-isoprenylcysteine O-methyltransferase Ste14